MSRESLLCTYCVQIPFDPEELSSKDGRLERTFQLGPGSRVASSRCPFCRLVKQAYYESYREAPDFLSEISVTWELHLGPGGRGAFSTAKDTWIGFAAPDDASLARKATNDSFYVKPTTDPTIDITQILRWISRCEDNHSDRCWIKNPERFTVAFPGLDLLRLIDVKKRCIVEMRTVPKYVALSYVWGSVSNFRLTKANRNKLLAPGSLSKVWEMLPRTIQDAATVVQCLGAQYLWVDSLCLLQNDIEDLGRGVNIMDLIYERAWVTVIASYGHDANAGLPGVRKGSRRTSRNTIQIKAGVSLGVVTGLDQILKASVYNSRAWTFQEQVLSRRVLYFADTKIFFRCRKEEFIESCIDRHSVPSSTMVGATVGSLLPEAIRGDEPLFDYSVMLFYYTARVLTNQEDALRAMAGVIRRFTEVMKCRFFEGLPTVLFDVFLLFRGRLLHRRPSFPSYSWTGWRGGVDFEMSDFFVGTNDWLRDRTWIIWYKRSASGVTNLVWDPEANESFPSQDLTYKGYRKRCPFSARCQALKHLDTTRTAPTQDMVFSRSVPPYAMLQFWTLAVFYTIGDVDEFKGIGYLLDRNQIKCGKVFLDSFEESTFFEQPGPFEAILLSQASDVKDSGELETCSSEYYPKKSDEQWRHYNILLLEWHDGIAERRGIGHVFQRAIENSLTPGPIWKEIFMA
ncbi:heterokaryon incompatibility protein-domain-containing protein [Leptodontidium sp. 2 PMI_412]|nr:heterokaryon incompatibility protein-domain-containing protein [Leptodontidium sp. 2 PMI_412]